MELGFETIGNATLICHDGRPVLATDPWLQGSAFFGSWVLSHEVPEPQRQAVEACEYVWISHGHPDHLSWESLERLREKTFLVPNHFGERLHRELQGRGFKVKRLLDRVWKQLSPRIRVLSIPDYNQDAVLLVELGGTLLVNVNDAEERGWGRFVRKVVAGFGRSFLLAPPRNPDAPLFQLYDEEGRWVPVPEEEVPEGVALARRAELLGVRYVVPFSGMHRYQRKDSLWAAPYLPRLDDCAAAFRSRTSELTPAFVRYDALRDDLRPIEPAPRVIVPVAPDAFGDDWSERLRPGEAAQVAEYFRSMEVLADGLDFVIARVGGEDHRIRMSAGRPRRGLTFEVPRASLLSAVAERRFDDLLLGRFMRTTLHGDWGPGRPTPDFTSTVARYADQARVKTRGELSAYLDDYRGRDPLGYLQHLVEGRAANVLRGPVDAGARLFRAGLGALDSMRRAVRAVR